VKISYPEGESVALKNVPFGSIVQHPKDKDIYYLVVNLYSVRGYHIYRTMNEIDLISLVDGYHAQLDANTMVKIAYGEYQITQLGNKQ